MNNRTMIQFFHWYSPGNGILWKDFAGQVSYLAGLGYYRRLATATL